LGEPATAEAIDSPDPDNHPNFIESNTNAITLEELSNNLIPTWADNSLTISHTNFIKTVRNAAVQVFGNLTPVEIRTSHPIQGRRPEAIHKKQNELTENDKTIYYQRMAFISHVVGLSREVNGQIVNLTIGGVRNYADEQLYRTATPQRFKIFVGWQVRVCSNMMLTCNGNSGVIQCLTEADVFQKTMELFTTFNPERENILTQLANLQTTRMTEQQFCNIIGRMRLYQALPVAEQHLLPPILLGDQAMNEATRGYFANPNFCKREGEDGISCWNFLQLMTEAVKSSYIDKFTDRNQNAVVITLGIQNALNGNDEEGYSWFLS
jgi:hypothetical protein